MRWAHEQLRLELTQHPHDAGWALLGTGHVSCSP